jgi:hypothetical protein
MPGRASATAAAFTTIGIGQIGMDWAAESAAHACLGNGREHLSGADKRKIKSLG